MSRAARLKASIVLKSICHDAGRRLRLVSGQIGENTGGAKRDLSELERSAAVFEAYVRYGGDVCGRRILEIGSGDNILVALRFIAAGAKQVLACVSHALLNDVGIERLRKSGIDELITTDTVQRPAIDGVKIVTLSVAGLLGEAIKRIHNNSSVNSLFEFKGGRTS